MDRKKELLVRVYLVMAAFVVLSLVIMTRVVKVAIFEGEKWREKGNKNVKLKPVYAERGNIYAEDFSLLSTSLQFFEIHMDLTVVNEKRFNEEIDSLAICLSNSIGSRKSAAEWRGDLIRARKLKKQYFPIASKISIDEYNAIRKFPIFRYGRFGGGLIAKKFGERIKPFKQFASRTIGSDRENAQKIGIEGFFDNQLAGETQQVLMKRVSTVHDTWVPIYDMEEMEPRRGNDIVTTLDVNIQDIVHNELLSRCIELEAEGGSTIVMDVKTGAIKAISNFRRLENGQYAEIYNDGIGRLSEPGSTFKLASVLALLDDGYCDLNFKVDLQNGKMRFYDRDMYDSDYHGLRLTTMQTAFEKSSNVGIARLIHDHYNNPDGRIRFYNKLDQFGLLNKTDVEINGEPAPKVKHPVKDKAKWYGTTIPWMAHGYELMMTPLQILAFYNAVANDGVYMQPYLVSEIRDGATVIKEIKPKVRSRIASEEAVRSAKLMLEGVVKSGTGRKLQSNIVQIAGKTGTSRVNYARQNEKKEYNASFAGYFPADEPEYSMITTIYKPQGGVYYGAAAAGPVFKNIAERVTMLADNIKKSEADPLLAYADLPEANSGYKGDFQKVFDYVGLDYKTQNKGSWVEVDPYESKMIIDKKKISKDHVPDVRGMGARDAIYVLENLGLQVSVNGVGKVKKQTISPGTKIKGQDITIYLN